MEKVDKQFVAVKAFVVREDGKILMLQESTNYKDGTNAGKWDVLGGRISPGELWNEALLREVKEESGLEVSIGRPFAMGDWRPIPHGEQWQVIATFFECHLVGDPNVILSQDHTAFEWFAPEEILTLENCASFLNEAAKKYIELKRA